MLETQLTDYRYCYPTSQQSLHYTNPYNINDGWRKGGMTHLISCWRHSIQSKLGSYLQRTLFLTLESSNSKSNTNLVKFFESSRHPYPFDHALVDVSPYRAMNNPSPATLAFHYTYILTTYGPVDKQGPNWDTKRMNRKESLWVVYVQWQSLSLKLIFVTQF